MTQLHSNTAVVQKKETEELLSYSERLNELPLADLLIEARLINGISKEHVLITVLAKRLEEYSKGLEHVTAIIEQHLEAA